LDIDLDIYNWNKKLLKEALRSNNRVIAICRFSNCYKDTRILSKISHLLKYFYSSIAFINKILERIKRENETFSPTLLQTAILLGLKNCFDKKLFPMVGNQNSNSWIQILPQNVNVERIGPCIGEGTLLTHFQKDGFWFTIWNVNGQTIEAKNLKDLNSLSQKQELFLKI
jgi:hypothetical protein